MSSRDTKREEAIKNRFVEHLRKTEGLCWTTKAQDVPTRNGRKNFDYLLECNHSSLALEITTRNDDQESLAHNSMSLAVWDSICRLIQLQNLNGCTWFSTPSSFSMSSTKLKSILKHQGREVAAAIEESSNALEVGEEQSLQTRLGLFTVGRVKGQPDLLRPSAFRWDDCKLAEAEYQECLAFLEERTRVKDEQLDTDADRRVLLISDNAPFGKDLFRDAVFEFFSHPRDEMTNIDEVFIEFQENDFERVYSGRLERSSFIAN